MSTLNPLKLHGITNGYSDSFTSLATSKGIKKTSTIIPSQKSKSKEKEIIGSALFSPLCCLSG